jgi:glycosyltransferase involved in cell wall biosynthesis
MQTYTDFEVIVVDDASTDDTPAVVADFEDERIKYIRHIVNRGEGGARNTGVRSGTGEYIAFLDDDDVWRPEKLQLQVEALARSSEEIGAVYTGTVEIDVLDRRILRSRLKGKNGDLYWDLITKEQSITVSSVLVRKSCFDKVGLFDESIPAGLDYDMWLRIAREFKFVFIKLPLVEYGMHEAKMGRQWQLQIDGREALIRKHGGFISQDNRGYSRWLQRLGMLYYLDGNKRKGKDTLLEAIRANPYAVKVYAALVLCMVDVRLFKKVIDIKSELILRLRRAVLFLYN